MSVVHRFRTLPFLVIFLLSAMAVSGTEFEGTIESASDAVFRVETWNSRGQLVSTGSGFAIGDEGLVITNAHVVETARYDDSCSLILTSPHLNGAPDISATIVTYDSGMDLCLLRPDVRPRSTLELARDEDPAVGSEVIVLGFPLGQSFKATPGSVQAIQDVPGIGGMLDLSATVVPGNSGGPVLDARGRVIGIATAAIPGYNFNLAIPARNVHRFLDGAGGRINVSVEPVPAGSRVFINGRYQGVSPLELDLPATPFNLRVQSDGYQEYSEDYDGSGDVVVTRSLQAVHSGDVEVRIETVPEGAEVFVNNRNLGESPVVLEVPQGKKLRIRVVKRRYRDHYSELRVGDGPTQVIRIELER